MLGVSVYVYLRPTVTHWAWVSACCMLWLMIERLNRARSLSPRPATSNFPLTHNAVVKGRKHYSSALHRDLTPHHHGCSVSLKQIHRTALCSLYSSVKEKECPE